MAITARRSVSRPIGQELFSRVLVGVDETPASVAAVRQGAILAERTATLELLAAFDASRRDGPASIFLDADPDRERARERLDDAARFLPAKITAATTTVVPGPLAAALLDEVELGHDTVVVISGESGATVTEVLYGAACSVLVARARVACPPALILVGVDWSPESGLAYAAGRYLARRFAARLAVRSDLDDASALEADAADLLIVGNRGLHGAKALGSVAEHAAHDACCSVLVVRGV
jgi:nucleotide-binding universal stress UspA family protein